MILCIRYYFRISKTPNKRARNNSKYPTVVPLVFVVTVVVFVGTSLTKFLKFLVCGGMIGPLTDLGDCKCNTSLPNEIGFATFWRISSQLFQTFSNRDKDFIR